MLRRQKTGLGMQVYQHVKQLLLDGAIHVDTLIPIDSIAADLGVSRQPVMEAVRRLALEGFVSITPQVGSCPRQYDAQEMIDFLQASRRGRVGLCHPRLSTRPPAQIKRLKAASSEIGQLIDSQLDRAELAQEYRMMGDVGDFLVATAEAPIFMERLKMAHKEHQAMIAAIEARDTELAVLTMRRHVLAVAGRIAQRAEERGRTDAPDPATRMPGQH